MFVRRVPSFSDRPGFPEGLRVLLLDTDYNTLEETRAQLCECSFTVVACSSIAQANACIANSTEKFDVLLSELRSMLNGESKTILTSSKAMPLVLYTRTAFPKDVMSAIKMGAVEVIENPCVKKLRNIWQHVVRRMMDNSAMQSKKNLINSPALSGNADSITTPDLKNEYLADLDASTYQPAAMHASKPRPGVSYGEPASKRARSMDLPVAPHMTSTRILSCPSSPMTSVADLPVQGFSAGQLPCLPDIPGIEWGIPTSPLQIMPKPMVSPMPWPMMAMFPPMFQPATSMPTASTSTTPTASVPPSPAIPPPTCAPAPCMGTACDMPFPPLSPDCPFDFCSSPSASDLSSEQYLPASLCEPTDLSPPWWADDSSSDLFAPPSPPIGLALRKSNSFADLISDCLRNTRLVAPV